MAFSFQPMDESSARQILTWRYDAPYDLYNPGAGDAAATLRVFVDPQYAYYVARDSEGVVAYCCFGLDAQVPGGDYGLSALDIGLGARPDLTGRGLGSVYVQATLDFARRTSSPDLFRVTVAAFNTRARRVWDKAGFRQNQEFYRESDGLGFVVMVRQE